MSGEPIIVPPLKWAGGKRWLIQSRALPIPSFRRYIEPFFGSGAVFFALKPERSIISDCNADLIETYRAIRDRPDLVRRYLVAHQSAHSKEHYYQVRCSISKSQFKRAARFLYLNRTCWNGLYRVNRSGQFNVPIGTKNNVVYESDDFYSVAQLLRRTELIVSDFQTTIDQAGQGDFVFADPPYTTAHNTNGFVKYNQNIFSWEDQVRLADCLKAAILRGARVALTNADHQSVRDLYQGIMSRICLERSSVIASKANHRRRTTELLYLSHA